MSMRRRRPINPGSVTGEVSETLRPYTFFGEGDQLQFKKKRKKKRNLYYWDQGGFRRPDLKQETCCSPEHPHATEEKPSFRACAGEARETGDESLMKR